MALSTKKKNIIIADWKTGKFKSHYAIAKHYKVSPPTIAKILLNIGQENSHIVEAGVEFEEAKKITKNIIEINAIDKAIKERVSHKDLIESSALAIVNGLNKSVKKGKAQKVITEGQGMGASMGAVIEYDMQPEHYEKAMNTIDKASITLGVNERFSSSKVEVNTQQNKEAVVWHNEQRQLKKQ